MIKEEIIDVKDSLLKKFKLDVDKTVDFMKTTFELIIDESKELKGKFSMLVNEN